VLPSHLGNRTLSQGSVNALTDAVGPPFPIAPRRTIITSRCGRDAARVRCHCRCSSLDGLNSASSPHASLSGQDAIEFAAAGPV
jgi:hypothetical protein